MHLTRTSTDGVIEVTSFLPSGLASALRRLPASLLTDVRELRLRVGRPVMVVGRGNKQLFVGHDGAHAEPSKGVLFRCDDAAEFLQAISRSSVYALEEEFRQGFLTLPGGHRVGLCGEVALDDGRPRTLKHVGSFNVRIARQVRGAADRIISEVAPVGRQPRHTLIISPPGGGKTTLLRDLARQLSEAWQVGVIDERSEIAACFRGVPQLDVGPRTDVIDRCPKSIGIMQMLRSMAPQVIISDEIGRPEDVAALLEAMNGGVTVVASAHGRSWEEVAGRPALAPLIREGAFQLVVVLGGANKPGSIEKLIVPAAHRRARHTARASTVHMR